MGGLCLALVVFRLWAFPSFTREGFLLTALRKGGRSRLFYIPRAPFPYLLDAQHRDRLACHTPDTTNIGGAGVTGQHMFVLAVASIDRICEAPQRARFVDQLDVVHCSDWSLGDLMTCGLSGVTALKHRCGLCGLRALWGDAMRRWGEYCMSNTNSHFGGGNVDSDRDNGVLRKVASPMASGRIRHPRVASQAKAP